MNNDDERDTAEEQANAGLLRPLSELAGTVRLTVTVNVPVWVIRDLRAGGEKYRVAASWCAGAINHAVIEEGYGE